MAQRRAQATDDALATYESILGFAVNARLSRARAVSRWARRCARPSARRKPSRNSQAIVREQAHHLRGLRRSYGARRAGPSRRERPGARRDPLCGARVRRGHRGPAAPSDSRGQETAQAYYTLGLCYQQTDQYEAAFASFDVVIEDFPDASPGARGMDGQGAGGQRRRGRPFRVLPRDGAPLPPACASPRGAMAGGGVSGTRGRIGTRRPDTIAAWWPSIPEIAASPRRVSALDWRPTPWAMQRWRSRRGRRCHKLASMARARRDGCSGWDWPPERARMRRERGNTGSRWKGAPQGATMACAPGICWPGRPWRCPSSPPSWSSGCPRSAIGPRSHRGCAAGERLLRLRQRPAGLPHHQHQLPDGGARQRPSHRR